MTKHTKNKKRKKKLLPLSNDAAEEKKYKQLEKKAVLFSSWSITIDVRIYS